MFYESFLGKKKKSKSYVFLPLLDLLFCFCCVDSTSHSSPFCSEGVNTIKGVLFYKIRT